MSIDPRPDDVKRFVSDGPDAPFVMLNLLRFTDNGRARYREYMAAAAPFLAKAGGELVYFGEGTTPLVGDPQDPWNAVLLVRYPSRAAFLAMVSDPAYVAITHLRTEALRETILQPTKAAL